jgi:hypothetical protein
LRRSLDRRRAARDILTIDVAHELLEQLRDGLDGTGVTEDRVVYFDLVIGERV